MRRWGASEYFYAVNKDKMITYGLYGTCMGIMTYCLKYMSECLTKVKEIL